MLCNMCKNNEANVHITRIINGKKEEYMVCQECAKQFNNLDNFSLINSSSFMSPFSVQNILTGMLDYINDGVKINNGSRVICKHCGTTYDEFKQKGLLGCDKCYECFKSTVMPIVKRVQGNVEHVGKIPKKSGKEIINKKTLLKLKMNLQKCIAEEEYEKAAEIRDEIRNLEKEGEK